MLMNSLLYYFFLVYLARSKRPNTPHFVFKRIVWNFEVRAILMTYFFFLSGAIVTNKFCLQILLMLYVHGNQMRSCQDGQLSYPHCSWASL